MGYVAATRQTFPSYWAPISLALYPAALVLVRCVGVCVREGERGRETEKEGADVSDVLGYYFPHFLTCCNTLQHRLTEPIPYGGPTLQ